MVRLVQANVTISETFTDFRIHAVFRNKTHQGQFGGPISSELVSECQLPECQFPECQLPECHLGKLGTWLSSPLTASSWSTIVVDLAVHVHRQHRQNPRPSISFLLLKYQYPPLSSALPSACCVTRSGSPCHHCLGYIIMT